MGRVRLVPGRVLPLRSGRDSRGARWRHDRPRHRAAVVRLSPLHLPYAASTLVPNDQAGMATSPVAASGADRASGFTAAVGAMVAVLEEKQG